LIGVDDVAELRALLRRADRVARNVAYGVMDGWSGADLDEVGARAVLEAAAGTYPSIPGDHRHPGESLIRILWERPRLVGCEEVLRAFLIAGERARRALVHLLARRRDSEGLEAVESLFSTDGPIELLPSASMPVLDPLLEVGQRDRTVRLLCRVLFHEGWTWHAAELLRRMERDGKARPEEQAVVLEAASVLVAELVDVCDRSCANDPIGRERARAQRECLANLARLLDELVRVDPTATLHRMMASADPRVAALGATRLLGVGASVAPERIDLIARDPVARADLYDGLRAGGVLAALPRTVDEVAVREAMLARWLSEVTELGRAPDEMEFVGTTSGPSRPGGPDADAVLFGFRFRVRVPHWSSAKGWMIGVAGPWTGTCYSAEDEMSLTAHVAEISAAMASWPRRWEDGAA
jgi:hypothetical protein